MQVMGVFEGNYLFEAEGGGGMLAGAETQSGIENDGCLAGFSCSLAPAWFDQQSRAELDGFEMALPGLGPILWRDLAECEVNFARMEPRLPNSFQGGDQASFFRGCKESSILEEVADDGLPAFDVSIRGAGFREELVQQFADCLFRLGRGLDRQVP